MTRLFSWLVISFGSLAVLSATHVSPAAERGSLTPGVVVDRENVHEFADYLTNAMRFAVEHGLRLKLVPAQRIEWPAEYQRATEQHAAQVVLDKDDEIRNYVAGLPFPSFAPDNLKAAVKIAYNWRWGPFIPEEVFGTNLATRAYTFKSDGRTFAPELAHSDFRNEYLCDQAVAVRTSHRLHPTAIDGTGETDWKFRDDNCGPEQSKLIAWLYSEGGRKPDSFFYMQATRRWHRMAVSASPSKSCSYACSQMSMEYTAPQTSLYSWKMAGSKVMLGCMSGGTAMGKSGDDLNFDELTCEPRQVYVLDMTPKDSGSDQLSARVYIDSETYVYLGAEILRDRTPDLSAAIWKRDSSTAENARLVLAGDLYVPDERPDTFLWLDTSGRLTFAGELTEKMFNPKAEN